MSRKRLEGNCHICGRYGPLSYEHVPPRAAFNEHPVIAMDVHAAGDAVNGLPPRGHKLNQGAGGYTLCGRCNNLTGGWYGRAFAEWCEQGMRLLIGSNGRASLTYRNQLYPLRVLKQIVTMFCSVSPNDLHRQDAYFTQFLLDRNTHYLPPGYRFYVYYNLEGLARRWQGSVVMDIETGVAHHFAEISHPPYGYVMTINTPPPDERLVDITHFATYAYDDLVQLWLKLPVLPTRSPMPGMYHI